MSTNVALQCATEAKTFSSLLVLPLDWMMIHSIIFVLKARIVHGSTHCSDCVHVALYLLIPLSDFTLMHSK